MNVWDRYWFGPVAAVRPYLLLKATLFFLSFDAWLLMLEHGGRYGVGDFNVAHFRWMDLVLPVPTPAIYVGLMLFVGILAFAIACTRTNRVALAALALLYTYGWSMSMLDSYQHHYLLSLVLFCFVFFPRTDAAALFETPNVPSKTGAQDAVEKPGRKKGKARRKRTAVRAAARRVASRERTEVERASAWAYVMLGVTFAIVYGYTAITKTEPDWIDGHALRRILGDAPVVAELAQSLYSDGVASGDFWKLLARGAVLVQLVLAVGYLVAARSDRARSPILRLCMLVFLFAALSFHGGLELLESGDDEVEVLDIGWFSYYMLVAACVYYLPAKVLDAVARFVTLPVRRVVSKLDEPSPERASGRDQTSGDRLGIIVASVAAAVVIVLAGKLVDLPGSLRAGVLAAVLLVAAASFAVSRGAYRMARAWIAATGLAALMMWVSIASSDVRFDFYRFVGGDARRRGEYALALEAYVKANRYAPEGKNRRDKEMEMRRLLGQGE